MDLRKSLITLLGAVTMACNTSKTPSTLPSEQPYAHVSITCGAGVIPCTQDAPANNCRVSKVVLPTDIILLQNHHNESNASLSKYRWIIVGTKFQNGQPHVLSVGGIRMPRQYIPGVGYDYDNDGMIDELEVVAPYAECDCRRSPPGMEQWVYRTAAFKDAIAQASIPTIYGRITGAGIVPSMATLRSSYVMRSNAVRNDSGPKKGMGEEMYMLMPSELERALNDLYAQAK